MSSSPLSLPQPCQQSWEAMPLTGPGRHCAACQQTVVDFTHLSTTEVLAYLAQAGSRRVCGAFRPDQVQLSVAPASRWRRWAVAVLTLLGLRAAAPAAVRAQAGRTLGAPVAVAASYPPRVVHGRVLAADTGRPVVGVAVLVAGTTQAVYTDAQGRFRLPLPALPATAQLSVVTGSSQLGSTRVALPAPGDTAALLVRLRATDPRRQIVVGKPLPLQHK